MNFLYAGKPDGFDMDSLDEIDRECVRRTDENQKWEFAYMNEQATKRELPRRPFSLQTRRPAEKHPQSFNHRDCPWI